MTKKAEPVWDPEQHPRSWRAVWAYSAQRAARDNKTLSVQENRAREIIAEENKAKTTRFVKNAQPSVLPCQDRSRDLYHPTSPVRSQEISLGTGSSSRRL